MQGKRGSLHSKTGKEKQQQKEQKKKRVEEGGRECLPHSRADGVLMARMSDNDLIQRREESL